MSSVMSNYYQLQNYTAITLKGDNSKELLQGQVSCDLNIEKDYYDGLFCDEKGYVITNATILFDEHYYILVKDEVSAILMSELKKFGQFFDCSIEKEKKDILGQEINGELKKLFGRKDVRLDSADWDEICMLNLCFDINEEMSGKFRINELGYDMNKYVSYDKGCYRGQEIIARLTYLGKKTKKVIVFDSNLQEITDSNNKPIGKKICSLHAKDREYSHFFVESTDYFSEGTKIIPVTNQWDLDLNQ
ncbi:MAG: hypothetical protein CMQ75_00755 [Gammaproteobacteria bacterium]|nr:hypothetical protein [Gammaproteobacteria bacterium]